MRVSEGIFDFFKKKEKTLADDPEYKGWLKVYLKNPDIAELHKRHKEFLEFFQQTSTNEGFVDFVKKYVGDFSGNEMEDEYIPFIKKNLYRYGDKRTLKMLMQKYPKIKPIDARRAMSMVLNKGAGT